MSGGALAASHYPINSTKQINPKVLKKLKGNAGAKGATGAAGAAGLQGKEGPQGKEGKSGPTGATGSTGSTGSAGATNVSVYTATETIASHTSGSAVAVCPAGAKATGGGVNPVGVTGEAALVKSYPSTGGVGQATEGTATAWGGWVYNPTGGTATLYVSVICASP
jgi:hypothetical protein